MTRLLDCQDEHRKPADLLDGRVLVDPFDSRVSYRLNEYGEPCALYRPPIGAYLAGAFVWLAFIALAVSFYRVGRWCGWWP